LDFAGLWHCDEHIPTEASILRFRHLLDCRQLTELLFAAVNALL
jgi:IS5 family transposase